MRKIVAGLFQTLDGVVESPQDWNFQYFNDEMGQAVGSQMAASDAMLLGRKTYQEFASYWPSQPDSVPMAAQMNGVRKYVVSTVLETAEWNNTTVIGGDIYGELTKLKEESGMDIGITGSITLVRSLLRENLLDELRLLVHPVVVGKGGRLFDDWASGQLPMKLTQSQTFTTGVLSLVYEPISRR